MTSLMNHNAVKELLIELGLAVNKKCTQLLLNNTSDLNREVKVSPADIIYQIDIEAEEEIITILKSKAHEFGGIELIAEGIGENDLSFYPENSDSYSLRIICDPIDGSRGLMYGKRPAFFLAAAGPASAETLQDMEVSVMVELPIPKQNEFDVLSAVRNKGFEVFRHSIDGDSRIIKLEKSAAKSVEGGFMSFAKFCYPGKDLISKIEEAFLNQLFEDRKEEFLPVFDDQYISTGGQMYELICGHDRFTADFRGSLYKLFKLQGKKQGQVCHPYDMAGLLIAEEAGIIVTDLRGKIFNSGLSTDIKVDWIAYANESIRQECEEILKNLLWDEKII